MIAVLLILIPLITGCVAFLLKADKAAKSWSLFSSLATLAVSVAGLTVLTDYNYHHSDTPWITALGSNFTFAQDGMGKMLTLLTAISFSAVFISTWKTEKIKSGAYHGFMLLMQAGIMGVFLSADALLFYFFWELALIPAYFLCSGWGGERRIAVTIKFFIYTFIGSLFMLIGIIYLYFKTPDQSFALTSFYNIVASPKEQSWLFWLFFIAFAVKMPIFPFHTWQPDTYEQAPIGTTMILSGVMVKMGIFGVIKWLAPVLPTATWAWGDTVSWMCIIGMIYASLLAMVQDDLRRLVAYSSIAHIGLMCLAIFSSTDAGMNGVMIQMFNHGINVIGLWIIVGQIEKQFGTGKISQLGGMAQKAPALSILLVIFSLANIALPLTNSFVGEFLMFSGVFNSEITKYSTAFTAFAIVTIILAAVYTLNMLRRVLFGEMNALTQNTIDLNRNEKLVLSVFALLILVLGVYPQPFFELTNDTVSNILSRMLTKTP